jgi:hypothetical protein
MTRSTIELIHCPECLGDGTLTYERPEPWVNRDLPPSLEEYQAECWNCHGSGEIEALEFEELDHDDGQPTMYEEYQDLYGGDDRHDG